MKSLFFLLLLSFTVFAQTPPACRSLPPIKRGAKKVTVAPPSGIGSEESPYLDWEDQINAAPESARIHLPGGFYGRRKTIYVKRGWTIEGDGQEATIIVSVANATPIAIDSLWPSNCSTRVKFNLRGLSIESGGQANQRFALRDNGGTFLHLFDVLTRGFEYGFVFDQTELFDVELCDFEDYGKAGVWYVNGDSVAPGNHAGYTNRSSITKSQFNAASPAIGLIIDGAVAVSVQDNNFNGNKHYIFVAGVQNGRIVGNEMEGSTAEGIFTWYQRYEDYLNKTQKGVGGNINLSISENLIVSSTFAIGNNYLGFVMNNFLGGHLGGLGLGCDGWAPPSVQLGNAQYEGKTLQTCADVGPTLKMNYEDAGRVGFLPKYQKTANFGYLLPGTCEEIEYTGFQKLPLGSFVVPSVDYTVAAGSTPRVRDHTIFTAFVKATNTIVLRRCNFNGRVPASKIPGANVTLWVK